MAVAKYNALHHSEVRSLCNRKLLLPLQGVRGSTRGNLAHGLAFSTGNELAYQSCPWQEEVRCSLVLQCSGGSLRSHFKCKWPCFHAPLFLCCWSFRAAILVLLFQYRVTLTLPTVTCRSSWSHL